MYAPEHRNLLQRRNFEATIEPEVVDLFAHRGIAKPQLPQILAVLRIGNAPRQLLVEPHTAGAKGAAQIVIAVPVGKIVLGAIPGQGCVGIGDNFFFEQN